MKKLIAAVMIAVLAVTGKADVEWSWWCENTAESTDISLGIATKCAKVEALELSLLYGASNVEGVQWSLLGINDSDMSGALQMSMWFNRGDDPCVQLGLINCADTTVFSWGMINVANKATVQLGLLNFNKSGFLSIFPFVNLDKALFD